MVDQEQVILSDTNRTPIVQIVTWFTLVTSLLAFFTHAGIKFYVFRALTIESWFVLTSLVSSTLFGIFQSFVLTVLARCFALLSLPRCRYKLIMDLEHQWPH
jgi:hypothetical protein